jgi:DNA polymerase III epsilon subunit-like protein
MDLSSRLRAIVKSGPAKATAPALSERDVHASRRELTYEPDTGRYEASTDLGQVGAVLGGRPADTPFGRCLVVDRRYEADRWHGGIRIGDCEVDDFGSLTILDPALADTVRGQTPDLSLHTGGQTPGGQFRTFPRTIFIDLETTGLSGGAGTVAFLVGCGYFDLGAFQVRQFLLTSFASERALLHAVAEFFKDADLIVTYNGKTFDVPVMETRWLFHRLQMPLDSVPHFDMLHPARRLWRARSGVLDSEDGGCRLSTLERTLFNVNRVGDVDGFEVPSRFFRFLRSGDPRPLEPVLEHNRLDLVSLAAVMARAVELTRGGHVACRDCSEALALGRVYERAALDDRLVNREHVLSHAETCYRRGAQSRTAEVKAEALYRLALRHRRERRFSDAAALWREILDLTEPKGVQRITGMRPLRRFAAEALAIHHEHRDRDLDSARELALFALQDSEGRRAEDVRHRLARLDRKIAKKTDAQLFWS